LAPLAPASAATTVPLPAGSTAPQTVAIPPAAGLSGSLVLPAATLPAGTTLTVQTTTTAPSGLAPLSAARRTLAASGLQVLYYQGIAFTQSVTFSAFPAFSISLPAGYDPSKGVFELAFYDGHGWTYPLGAPGTASGQQLSFAAAAGPVTYAANQIYYFALYYAATQPAPTPTPTATPAPTDSPVPTATPTTSPTASPTATPVPTPTPTPGPVTAAPSVLSFVGTGPELAKTVTVSSQFYSGTFTASACTNADPNSTAVIATVGAVAANNTFTVTPVTAGACSIVVSDAGQRQTTVSVTVATSSLTVQGKH
jgi:hypothetical protein